MSQIYHKIQSKLKDMMESFDKVPSLDSLTNKNSVICYQKLFQNYLEEIEEILAYYRILKQDPQITPKVKETLIELERIAVLTKSMMNNQVNLAEKRIELLNE